MITITEIKNKIINKDFTEDELSQIDFYFDKNIEEIFNLTNLEIKNLIDLIEDEQQYSFIYNTLSSHISYLAFDALIIFSEKELDNYIRYLELCELLEFEVSYLGIALGEYFYRVDKEKALYYYEKGIKYLDIATDSNFYYPLKRYLDLTKENNLSILNKLIDKASSTTKYDLEYLYVLMSRLNLLDNSTKEYLKSLDNAIKISEIIVKSNHISSIFNASDEAKAHCELLSLKMKYYLDNDDYQNTFKLYKELTTQIHKLNCTRYYHPRDLFYYQMLEKMSNTYPELKFFKDIKFQKFTLIENCNNLEELLNKEVTLECDDKLRYKFKLINVSNYWCTFIPTIPLIGEGASLILTMHQENDFIYFS